MLWEENFTLGEFTAVNMKKFGHRNVRKHIYSNDSEKYINLDILLKYDSLYKTGITSSQQKYDLGISGKGMITFLGLKTNVRRKNKNERYNITNISMKDISKIIMEF